MKAILVLEDGTAFHGESFGKQGETIGEVVFNTCMTGYQEILTDPSYNGQIVTMTYPLIGNYGFNEYDNESYKPHAQGFIVKELCETASNWRNTSNPNDYFQNMGIVGIKGIDTRSLTQHIRAAGSMNCIISTESGRIEDLLDKIKASSSVKRNLVQEVSVTRPVLRSRAGAAAGKKVAVLDFGVKYNILRSLENRGCEVHLLPFDTNAEEVLKYNPDGILLSNGPGDPKDLSPVIETVKKLLGKKPMMGICLGHQLLGLSLGGNTYKLKFGHHGGNHPVKDYITGKCYITSQNHNYALEPGFSSDIEITHMNVNDNTVEGFRHKSLPVISVQYHPEAAPGPQDSAYIFDDFVKMM